MCIIVLVRIIKNNQTIIDVAIIIYATDEIMSFHYTNKNIQRKQTMLLHVVHIIFKKLTKKQNNINSEN